MYGLLFVTGRTEVDMTFIVLLREYYYSKNNDDSIHGIN